MSKLPIPRETYLPTPSGRESTPQPPRWGAKRKDGFKVPQMGDLGG